MTVKGLRHKHQFHVNHYFGVPFFSRIGRGDGGRGERGVKITHAALESANDSKAIR